MKMREPLAIKMRPKKIEDINKYFSIVRDSGYKVIFRVVYDSEGKQNPETEVNIILKQIEQLKDKLLKDNE